MNEKPKPSQENPFISLMANIAIPTYVFMKLSDDSKLGPTKGLLVALSFPLIYSIYFFLKRRKFDFISGLGFVSILLTGGLGLLKLAGIWFAVKEATIPGLIGIAVLFSMRSKFPLVKKLLYNDSLVHVELIEKTLEAKGTKAAFEKSLEQATYLIALSFALSAMINFLLAYFILKSPTGTPEFNAELGYMNAITFPIILVSCTSLLMFALWRLVKQIQNLTGLDMDTIFRTKK